MGKNSPNRQAHRTQTALKTAFIQLLGEADYNTISIGDIVKRANVGRSTFYHHYKGKADILLDWHEDIFQELNLGRYTPAEWNSNTPPAQLTAFFENMKKSRMPLHNFGQDFIFVLRSVGETLTKQIEENLKASLLDTKANLPLEVTARSIAGIYMGIFQWWIFERPPYSSQEMAKYIHQMIAATVRASIN